MDMVTQFCSYQSQRVLSKMGETSKESVACILINRQCVITHCLRKAQTILVLIVWNQCLTFVY